MIKAKQTAVVLTMKSGRQHILLVDLESMEMIFPNVLDSDVSKVGLTSTDSRISFMGQEILSRINPQNTSEKEFYLAGYNYSTFLNRIASFEIIADSVEVSTDGRVTLKYNQAAKSAADRNNSIVKIETKYGEDHYAVIKNEDADKIFAGVYSDSSPIVQATSENPSSYITAKAVSYNDLGDGAITGMFYVTNTNYALFMNNFEGMQIIRTNVGIEPNGYIVGGNN